MDKAGGNGNAKKVIAWAAVAVYAVLAVVTGKLFAERYLAVKIAESYLSDIRQGVDDQTLDDIVDSIIIGTLGDGLTGTMLSEFVGGDDINDIYYALVNDMDYRVYAIEKLPDGRYRMGVTIGNNNNITVARQAWELIKARYQGGIIEALRQLQSDVKGDISELLSQYFVTAAQMLGESSDIRFTRSFVISVDPSAEGSVPVVENENGYTGFIMTCAGIPINVGNPPDITDERKIYGAIFGAVLAVGIIAGAVCIYRAAKRKKSAQYEIGPVAVENASEDVPEYAPVRTATAILYARTPQHDNVMFAIHDTPLFIGRDAASCKVVFAPDSVGVSGRHCAISFDSASGDFVLTDLRSTYGTFLGNGERLTANRPYRLHSGDSFYTGDPANLFIVDLR